MTISKTNYENSVSYHLPTMELKRKSILGYLTALQEGEHMPGAHTMSCHGYFKTALLQDEIAFTMGWVTEMPGRLHCEPRIGIDYSDSDTIRKITATIQNMERKGYIKLSKSGKAFKILDTWRCGE